MSCAGPDDLVHAVGRIALSDVFSNRVVITMEFVFSLIFLASYVLSFLIAKEPWRYLINPFTIADMLTIVSGLVSPAYGKFYWGFLNLRFLRLYRSMHFLRRWGWQPLTGGKKTEVWM